MIRIAVSTPQAISNHSNPGVIDYLHTKVENSETHCKPTAKETFPQSVRSKDPPLPFATMPSRAGNDTGQLVRNCEAVEEKTRRAQPSTTTVIRIERGTHGFCRGVQKQRSNETSPQDVGKRPCTYRCRSESTLGKSEKTAKGRFNCAGSQARQANAVGIGSSQDRGGSTGEVGEGEAAKENGITHFAQLSHNTDRSCLLHSIQPQ